MELAIDDVDALQQEDAAQATLMAEAVIAVVAEDDTVIGPMSKLEAHHGAGHYHRAFSVLLFNTKGEMLLPATVVGQGHVSQRLGKRMLFAPTAQPEELELENAMGVKRAAVRKLEQELGIDPAQVSTDDMVYMTKMRYSARMNQEWIERELDHIIVMCADVEINPNLNEVTEHPLG